MEGESRPIVAGWYKLKKAENTKTPQPQRGFGRKSQPEEPKHSSYVYCFDKNTALIEKGHQYIAGDLTRPWDWNRIEGMRPRYVIGSVPKEVFTNMYHKVPQAVVKQVPVDFSYKAIPDTAVSFGDGGYSELSYPLYVSGDKRALSEDVRLEFLRGLEARASRIKDVQTNGSVVEDIIDPNLFPRKIENASWKRRTYQQLLDEWRARNPDTDYVQDQCDEWEVQVYKESSSDDSDDSDEYDERYDRNPTPENFLRREKKFVRSPHPGFLLREKYSWVPTDFLIKEDGSVQILSNINMVPRDPESIYMGFERAFESMVPCFRALNIIGTLPTTLQVVCKAQRYNLLPGQTYEGYWHREGQNERIVGVGVYYVDVSPGIVGGALKFRPAQDPPSPSYQEYIDEHVDLSIGVQTNSFVVFSNALPHRVRLMENKEESTGTRTFINFFVVDPSYKLPTSSSQLTFQEAIHELQLACSQLTDRFLPKEIALLILEPLNLWKNLADAKEFREKARLAMMRSKTGFGGWAHYHFGNCGVQRFVQCQTMDFKSSRYDNNETLQASSSQDASDLEGQIIKRSKTKRIRRRAKVS